jgi:hypothetical protein
MAALLAACNDATTVPDGLTADEADALASAMVEDAFATSGAVAIALTDAGTIGTAVPMAVVTTTFEATRTCPLGGDITFEGTRVREWDRETMNGTMDLSMTKTANDCARTVRDREVVVNGDPNIAVEVHRAREAGAWSGDQTMTLVGGFTWTAGDQSGSCTIDLSAVYDPDTSTRTVTGSFCGREIDRTTTWARD